MVIKEALITATNKLTIKNISTPSLDAEVLLAFILKKSREYLFTRPEKKLTADQLKKFNRLIKRRLKGEPAAYLKNLKEFYGLDFYVGKNVLIPRPETELIIDEVIKVTSDKRQAASSNKIIADIGTGSGCIAVTLKKYLRQTTVFATDLSAPALKIARKNARKHKAKIKFFRGDLLKPLKNKKIDLIVANLPYGKKSVWPKTSPTASSLKYEPEIALYAKKSGLTLYEKLFRQIAERKQKPKFVICELDPGQKNKMQKLAKKHLPGYRREIKKDLAGLNRIIILSE